MKTIVYKKIFNKYRIAKICESQGADITLRFEEPIEAKLFVGKAAYTVSCGIAKIPTRELEGAEITPKLYTGAGKEEIEGFSFTGSNVIYTDSDATLTRSIADAVSVIFDKLKKQETAISEIKSRLDQKLKF